MAGSAATQNRWQEAADDFRKGVRDRPISNGENTEYACLLLIVDDERGYQQFCSSLVSRPGEPKDYESAFQMARAVRRRSCQSC